MIRPINMSSKNIYVIEDSRRWHKTTGGKKVLKYAGLKWLEIHLKMSKINYMKLEI